MKKIKITADAVLAIIQGIFESEDVNEKINDATAPAIWHGKSITEALNVKYYTFKHRPQSVKDTVNNIQGDNHIVSELSVAYGLLSLGEIERLYSKDVDMIALNAQLQYYIQTPKIKFLEYLIENCNVETSGLRIPVQFGGETRKAVIVFGSLNVTDIQPAAVFGEMAVVELSVDIILYPDVTSYSDYTVNIAFNDNGDMKNADIPLASFSLANTMTQDSMPQVDSRRSVGNINLSRATSFVLVFEGYNNAFIDYLADLSLSPETVDNNQLLTLTVTRGSKSYVHKMIIKDHQVTVNSDTGNETHTLSLVKGV